MLFKLLKNGLPLKLTLMPQSIRSTTYSNYVRLYLQFNIESRALKPTPKTMSPS